MNAKQYFRRIRDTERRIAELKARQAHIRDLAYGNMRLSSSGVRSSSGNHSRLETAVIRLLDMDDRIAAELQACHDQIAEARALIDRIHEETYRSLLSMHYVSGLHWETIAQTMNYSVAHIYRLHGLALREADRILRSMKGATHETDSSVRRPRPVRDRDRRGNHMADPLAAKADDAGAGTQTGRGTV